MLLTLYLLRDYICNDIAFLFFMHTLYNSIIVLLLKNIKRVKDKIQHWYVIGDICKLSFFFL